MPLTRVLARAPAPGHPAQVTATAATTRSDRALSTREKRTLALLGLPTFGMALSITTVSTYLARVVERFTDSTLLIGAILGLEGLVAIALPIVVGSWSDRLRTRIGGRLPFLIAGTPVMTVALALMATLSSLVPLAVAALLFFAGYFTAYEPYRALYPDLVDEEIQGRAQSTQALWRGAGTGCALIGGGLLMSLAQPAPFAAAAGVLVAAVATFCVLVLRREGVRERAAGSAGAGVRERIADLRRLVRDHPPLRAYLAANALWELSLAALKSFVVLYVTIGLGKSLPVAVAAIGFAAVVILLGSPLAGKLADRLGRARVMHAALLVYGSGLLVPLVVTSPAAIVAIIPVVALGGAVLMTLPYALLVPMMPDGEHGALTGFYSLSRGLGISLGPLLAGGAIELLRGPLASTSGFAAMWGVCAAAIFLSVPLLRRVRR
jgi:Na+/melibiose symporter-like transporter